MWAKFKIDDLRPDQRAISTVIGGLIMISALFGLTTFVLAHKAQQGQVQARGLVDAMKEAEKRQAQLIDFSYSNEEGENLHVYISNYGWEDAKIRKVWIDGVPLNSDEWRVRLATTGNLTTGENTLPKRKFVYVEVDGGTDADVFALLTESNSVYKWEVGT